MNSLIHQSKVASDHLLIAKCIEMIHSSGDQGIKRGMLFFKAGVTISKFQNVHSILKDFEGIQWEKSRSTYFSMRHA
jgi:hypothetical protein